MHLPCPRCETADGVAAVRADLPPPAGVSSTGYGPRSLPALRECDVTGRVVCCQRRPSRGLARSDCGGDTVAARAADRHEPGWGEPGGGSVARRGSWLHDARAVERARRVRGRQRLRVGGLTPPPDRRTAGEGGDVPPRTIAGEPGRGRAVAAARHAVDATDPRRHQGDAVEVRRRGGRATRGVRAQPDGVASPWRPRCV